MSSEIKANIQYLEKLTGDNLPASIHSLSEDVLQDVVDYTREVVDIKTRGVDKAFEMTSVTIKFIPNFILFPLIKSYIEPPIAARIVKVLTTKQALDIASGLSEEYIAETAIFMDDKQAGEILASLRERLAIRVVRLAFDKKPIKLLDIFPHIKQDKISRLFSQISRQEFADLQVSSPDRQQALQQILTHLS